MDRVDAEKAGLALGLRFPPLANARPRGPRFSNGPTVLQIPRCLAYVLQMADRDGSQPGVFGFAKELPRSLTQLLDCGPTGGVMTGIHGGEQTTIFLRLPTSKALHRPLATRHAPGLAILVNQPRELVPGIAAHLLQIADDNAFLGFREGSILNPGQGV